MIGGFKVGSSADFFNQIILEHTNHRMQAERAQTNVQCPEKYVNDTAALFIGIFPRHTRHTEEGLSR